MLTFWRRRTAQGLVAKALYEELTPDEQAFLDRYLAADPGLRAEAEAMAGFVATIPADRPAPPADLLPLLKRRMATDPAAEPRRATPRYALLAAATVAALVLFVLWRPMPPNPSTEDMAAVKPTAISPLTRPLRQAEDLAAAGDYTGAYRTLNDAIQAYPDDEFAGDAQMRLADLVYSRLRWYDRAHEAYETLFRRYNDAVQASPERAQVVDRLNLLAEARQANFESLLMLDAARTARVNPVREFERVIVGYPGKLVASQAAVEMAYRVLEDNEDFGRGDDALLQALRHAQAQCADPMAVAQLNYEIGRVYATRLRDVGHARESFLKAAEHPALEYVARAALDGLAPPQ